jgi:methionyl aminopeptidase
MIVLKSPQEIAKMRLAGKIVAEILALCQEAIQPGITTGELNKIASQHLEKRNAHSPFLGYPNSTNPRKPFSGVICTSVNEEVVHGVPGKRVLHEGDIIAIDCGASYQGWIADSAWTFPVGKVSAESLALLDVTEQALYATISAAKVGNRTGDLAYATQFAVESRGFNVIREYTSHGVGRKLHEAPQILNHGTPGKGAPLKVGMTLALEPMVLSGNPETVVLPDDWTVAAKDGKYAAHFEHTIAITEDGPEILTKL